MIIESRVAEGALEAVDRAWPIARMTVRCSKCDEQLYDQRFIDKGKMLIGEEEFIHIFESVALAHATFGCSLDIDVEKSIQADKQIYGTVTINST